MHSRIICIASVLVWVAAPAAAQWVNVPIPAPIDFGAPLRDFQTMQQTQAAQDQARAAQAQARAIEQQTQMQQVQLEMQRYQFEMQLQQQRKQLEMQQQELAVGRAQQLDMGRISPVRSIIKPSTSDVGDDEYSYGARLLEGGFYPEAQQQLALFLSRYPTHARSTYARHLLGQAYFGAGDFKHAAMYFLDNFRTDARGARAGDSLLYLAKTMVALGDLGRACIALDEFASAYPALATGRLGDEFRITMNNAKCPA